MAAALIVLLVLLVIFGFWAVIKGLFWLAILLVVAFVVFGAIGGGLFKKSN